MHILPVPETFWAWGYRSSSWLLGGTHLLWIQPFLLSVSLATCPMPSCGNELPSLMTHRKKKLLLLSLLKQVILLGAPQLFFKKIQWVFFTHFLHTTYKSLSLCYTSVSHLFHYWSVCLVLPCSNAIAHPRWAYFLCLLLLFFEVACKTNIEYSRRERTINVCIVVLTLLGFVVFCGLSGWGFFHFYSMVYTLVLKES